MCIGIPMQIEASDGIVGHARNGETLETIDLSLTGPLPHGTWVLTFLGTAWKTLNSDEAVKIRRALEGLNAVMAGDPYADAFADLEETGPTLPPHLAAAQAAGKTEA